MDFSPPAEMYTGRQSAAGRIKPYRRFETLAEAVKFAVESQPAALMCTTIETATVRLQSTDIQAAYDSADFQAAFGEDAAQKR